MNESIYLDEDGLKHYKESIDNLIVNVDRISNEISRLRNDNVSEHVDEIHELYVLREQMLKRIDDMRNTLMLVKLIEKENNEDILELGDSATIELNFDDGDKEICNIKLISTESYIDNDTHYVSINSPLGRALYKKEVGSKTYYMIHNNKVNVIIIKKNNKVLKKV